MVVGKMQCFFLMDFSVPVSQNSTIIRSLLCPKSATVISDIRTGQAHVLGGASLGTARVLLGPFREKLLEWWKLRFESW